MIHCLSGNKILTQEEYHGTSNNRQSNYIFIFLYIRWIVQSQMSKGYASEWFIYILYLSYQALLIRYIKENIMDIKDLKTKKAKCHECGWYGLLIKCLNILRPYETNALCPKCKSIVQW